MNFFPPFEYRYVVLSFPLLYFSWSMFLFSFFFLIFLPRSLLHEFSPIRTRFVDLFTFDGWRRTSTAFACLFVRSMTARNFFLILHRIGVALGSVESFWDLTFLRLLVIFTNILLPFSVYRQNVFSYKMISFSFDYRAAARKLAGVSSTHIYHRLGVHQFRGSFNDYKNTGFIQDSRQ